MTKTLPELFAEVCGKVPAFDIECGPLERNDEGRFWYVGLERVHESFAETIIIGAAVRVLPEHSWIPYANRFLVTHLQTQTRYEAPTLAAALLLAVLAQAERSGT